MAMPLYTGFDENTFIFVVVNNLKYFSELVHLVLRLDCRHSGSHIYQLNGLQVNGRGCSTTGLIEA